MTLLPQLFLRLVNGPTGRLKLNVRTVVGMTNGRLVDPFA